MTPYTFQMIIGISLELWKSPLEPYKKKLHKNTHEIASYIIGTTVDWNPLWTSETSRGVLYTTLSL